MNITNNITRMHHAKIYNTVSTHTQWVTSLFDLDFR